MTAPVRGARVARVVSAVCAAAVEESGASGIVLLESTCPEGGLVAEWLEAAARSWKVWRAGRQEVPAGAEDALVAHPASKTALLLGGRLPRVDLLPAGDLWASEVAALTGDWSGPERIRALAAAAGGIDALDAALRGLVEERTRARVALGHLPAEVAAEVLACFERGRYWRLRPRLTPKLTARTLGIDLFD